MNQIRSTLIFTSLNLIPTLVCVARYVAQYASRLPARTRQEGNSASQGILERATGDGPLSFRCRLPHGVQGEPALWRVLELLGGTELLATHAG